MKEAGPEFFDGERSASAKADLSVQIEKLEMGL